MPKAKRATLGSCKSTQNVMADIWLSESILVKDALSLNTVLQKAINNIFLRYPGITRVEFRLAESGTPAKSSRSRRGSAKH